MNRIHPPFATARVTVSRLLLASALALPGAAVLAQATAPATPAPQTTQAAPTADMRGSHQGMDQHDPGKMQQHVFQRQAALKDMLKISTAQEPAWNAFLAAMKPPAASMQERRTGYAELQKLPTPERIDKMRALRTQHMAEMTKAMDQRGDATKVLYAALTPEQQKTFDAEAMQRGGRHAGGKHGNS